MQQQTPATSLVFFKGIFCVNEQPPFNPPLEPLTRADGAASLTALILVHNEEERLAACLERLSFCDEIVAVLDKCTDKSKTIAQAFNCVLIEGSWDIEGERRNLGLSACRGDWILEIDADEHVPSDLATEIRTLMVEQGEKNQIGFYIIPFDNFVGSKMIRHGWGSNIGVGAKRILFTKGIKEWGPQRVHPAITLEGPCLGWTKGRILHYVDDNLTALLRRIDRYATQKAQDMCERGKIDHPANNIRRLFSRFFKCYLFRKGYKEGGYGLLIAFLAGIFPLICYLKAKYEHHPKS